MHRHLNILFLEIELILQYIRENTFTMCQIPYSGRVYAILRHEWDQKS